MSRAHKLLDPLGKEDWEIILALDWRGEQRRIVDFFHERENEEIKVKELLDIMRGHNTPFWFAPGLQSRVAGMFSQNNLPFIFFRP